MSARVGASESGTETPRSTVPAPKYGAFISYRHTDYNLAHARSLETALRRYAKPIWRPPISIFRDDRVLKPGDDLPRAIRKALVGSEFLLYLATKDAAESTWVQDELRIWCAELRRADRLIIVHVSDSIEVDVALGAVNWEGTDALPAVLKPHVSSIPVWVDLSWASRDAQRDLLNANYRAAVNAITARFRNIEPGVMSDGEVITHRRNVRIRNGFTAVIVVSLLAAVYFGDQARRDRNRADNAAKGERFQRERAELAATSERQQKQLAVQAADREKEQRKRAEREQRRAEEQRALAEERTRQVELGEAYRLVTHGSDNLRLKDAERAQTLFNESARLLERLKLDPLMARHGKVAASAQQLDVEPIVDVAGEVSFLQVSNDGDLIAVVYDYQSPGGDPDLEDIPDKPAAGLYSVRAKRWILTHTVSSKIGLQLYALRPGSVLGLQAPDALVVDTSGKGDGSMLVLLSMRDGKQRACDEECRRGLERSAALLDKAVPPSLAPLLETQQLFRTSPADGIDEYSPRLVDQVRVMSPTRRTALVGTYEGRLLRLDLAAGLVQGEARLGPIFDIAYQRDGRAAFVADRRHIFRVDTSAWASIREFSVPLRPFLGETPYENVLEAAIADDGRVAIVTRERLLMLDSAREKWTSWRFPRRLGGVAAFAIDAAQRRAIVVSEDDGRLLLVNLANENELVEAPSVSGGQKAVAAITADASTVWGTAARPTSLTASVSKAIVGARGASHAATLSMPMQRSESLGSPLPAVHAIAALEDRLALFYGDARGSDENAVDNERMVSVRSTDAEGPRHRVLFEAKNTMTGVGNYSTVTQIKRVLPGSRPGRLLVSVGAGLSILSVTDNGVTARPGTLAFRERVDADQVYGVGVVHGASEKGSKVPVPARVVVEHPSSGAQVSYELPWSAAGQSQVLAAVDRKGEQIIVVGNAGHIVLCQVNAGRK